MSTTLTVPSSYSTSPGIVFKDETLFNAANEREAQRTGGNVLVSEFAHLIGINAAHVMSHGGTLAWVQGQHANYVTKTSLQAWCNKFGFTYPY